MLITGGAGFIGSAFIRYLLRSVDVQIVNVDALTYAADLRSLEEWVADPRYCFVKGDIRDEALIEELCQVHEIEAIVHFAAETHVDRSISGPKEFVQTNVAGTVALLEVIRRHPHIHFHHISTDEVYGSIETGAFQETSPYNPSSPYSASKAASDHFVHAYAHTYNLSYTMSHCTNNYGPCQHKEKLIPKVIDALIHKKEIPLYGTGKNVRDWLFVEDHAEAVFAILQKGKKGQRYAISSGQEESNWSVVHKLISLFASLCNESIEELSSLVRLVEDRPGHDFRYALNSQKLCQELQWSPSHSLEEGLKQTVLWYLEEAKVC